MPLRIIGTPILIALLSFWGSHALFGQSSLKVYFWKDSVNYWQSKKDDGRLLNFAERQKAKLEKKGLKSEKELAALLQVMAQANIRLGQISAAEKFLRQSLDIQLRQTQGQTEEVARTMHSLGILLGRLGRLEEAEKLVKESIYLQTHLFGSQHPEVAKGYFGLGNIMVKSGRFEDAGAYYQKALENNELPDTIRGEYINATGALYCDLGKLTEADSCFNLVMNIFQASYPEKDLHFADLYMHLGILNERIGNYEKAGSHFEKVLDILIHHHGEKHGEVADVYNNLGVIDFQQKNYAKAMKKMQKALNIKRSLGSEEDVNLATAIFNLGNLRFFSGQFTEAGKNFKESLEIFKKFLPADHLEMADIYNNIASVEFRLGHYAEAEQAYQTAIDILQKNHFQSNQKVAEAYHRMAVLHLVWGKMDLAEKEFRQFHAISMNTIQQYFPFFSDDEKGKFVQKISPYMDFYKAFCLVRAKDNPQWAGDLFDHQMATKGLLLHSSAKWRSRIQESRDTSIQNLYASWLEIQKAVYRQYSEAVDGEKKTLDSLENEAGKMEKELSRRSEDFRKLKKAGPETWKQLADMLSPSEALVEIIRIPKFGVEEIKTDSSQPQLPQYPVYGISDTIQYAFLVLKKNAGYPVLVVLPNGTDMETKFFKDYQKAIRRMSPDGVSYNRYWKEVAKTLTNMKTIWVSPDGVYHKFNLNTLENPQTKKYILEEKEIRLLTSSRDLLEREKQTPNTGKAVLMGAPQFSSGLSSTSKGSLFPNAMKFEDLPAAREELKQIQQVFAQSGISVSAVTGPQATESALKKVKNPPVLHLATHGFFQDDNQKMDNPMLQSGIVMANPGQKDAEGEDGVLTSMEAMNLSLENTHLVVLSACETGLGEVKNGEGVYGLQRAFSVAGTSAILMSLWKVSDQATQELMVRFYRNWLNPQTRAQSHPGKFQKNPGGISSPPKAGREGIRSAFLSAQKEIKKKYGSPFFWGAFVMIGL